MEFSTFIEKSVWFFFYKNISRALQDIIVFKVASLWFASFFLNSLSDTLLI